MISKVHAHSVALFVLLAVFLSGCSGSGSGSGPAVSLSPQEALSIKDFQDNQFPVKGYTKGMQKGAHRLLIWQDPAADLSGYRTVSLQQLDGRLLPVQSKYSYDPFIKGFNTSFTGSLKLKQQNSSDSLRIEGSLVECNPGSRAARYFVGMGAGKAAGAVAIEVYEPGKSRPSLRIYSRDTYSAGGFGGDSVAMLNHIFSQVAFRTAKVLNAKIGKQ